MSHTIEIPGGTAEMYDAGELTPRRMRPVQELALQLGNLLGRLAEARNISGAAEATDGAALGLTGPDVEIDARQAKLLATFSDLVTFMWLKSWSLSEPLPATADDLLDLPSDVYDALSKEAAKLQATPAADKFELGDATAHDTDSPTGASAD
jgi:hypothetical protein